MFYQKLQIAEFNAWFDLLEYEPWEANKEGFQWKMIIKDHLKLNEK